MTLEILNPDEILEEIPNNQDSDIINPDDIVETLSDEPIVDPDLEGAVEVKERDISKLESGLRGGAQGALFGFPDELAGSVGGISEYVKGKYDRGEYLDLLQMINPMAAGTGMVIDKLFGDQSMDDLEQGYTQTRDEYRAADQAAQDANPGTYKTAEFGSAAASTLIPVVGQVGRTAQVATKAPALVRAATGIAKGAGLGATTGAGYSEADIGSDEFTDDVTAGATVGGVTAGIGKTVLPTAKAANTIMTKAGTAGDLLTALIGASSGGLDMGAAALLTKMVSKKSLTGIVNSPNAQKYLSILGEAARRGGNSVAAQYYVMERQDPEFRKMVNDAKYQDVENDKE